jgi:hypothetical protein
MTMMQAFLIIAVVVTVIGGQCNGNGTANQKGHFCLRAQLDCCLEVPTLCTNTTPSIGFVTTEKAPTTDQSRHTLLSFVR